MRPRTATDPEDRFARQVTDLRTRVEAALEARLPGADDLPSPRLHQAMRYATLSGGKRLRACLVFAAGLAAGHRGSDLEPAACAVEMIHAYSLVHDDLPAMDDDELRRGQPTCHVLYGEATAILAGDALQCLAFEVLVEQAERVPLEHRLRMMRILAQASGHSGMAGGQAIDLAAVGQDLDLPRLQSMHEHKTGSLFRASVHLGLLAGPVRDAELERCLDRYAHCLGLAYQVVDDILDEEGETDVLGKTSGADRARNKPTYPALLGLAESRRQAAELLQEALASLEPLGDNGRLLGQIARYVVERSH
ncbi:MAG: polyprenyl synthetase family protein [Gammaproteobacteria bacterium]|nr:polyprenyl synthetase family protein [Gammaproteobacteria bacterium]